MAPRSITRAGTKTKAGLISLLSCCGCGGLAMVLLVMMGAIGAVLDPAPSQVPTAAPTTAAPVAERADAPAPSPSSSAPPSTSTAPAPSTTPAKASPKPSATPRRASSTPTATPSPTADTTTALGMLATLEVKGRAPTTGYDRTLFGWRDDVDHNGCDTRNDVLRRDLSDIVLKHGTRGCVVLSGTLTSSPYSGKSVAFHQQNENSLDIDHVVALSDAWQTGALRWDESTRHAFANDPLNLLAVESRLNRQKGSGDAATWLPPDRSSRCVYVARQIAVKAKYGLWVKSAERDAMRDVLTDCDGAAFAGSVATPDRWKGDGAREAPAPKPAVKHSPRPTPRSTSPRTTSPATPRSGSGGGDVYYKNCDAVRTAGAAPITVGEPGYSRKLDRDGDGIGCE